MREADALLAPRSRWRILAAFTAVAALGAGACGGSPTEGVDGSTRLDAGPYTNVDRSAETPKTGGRLRYGLPAETSSYNPGLAQWGAPSMQVARAVFDPLFEYDQQGEVHPFLLERAEHNERYTEWTLTLREDIRYHNGRKMTSTDVSRVAQHLMASDVVGTAWAINNLSGAAIVDERTLVVTSTKPWVTLPHQSASQLGFVPDPDWMVSSDWEHPVGSGPFKVDNWTPGHHLALERNPDYWRTDDHGTRLPYLQRIDFEIVPDNADRVELLRKGALDVVMQTTPGPAAALLSQSARDGEIQLVTEDRGETPEVFIALNTMHPLLADVPTRRGLAAAIDRRAASERLTAGMNPPADGIYEPSSPWYVPTSYPGYDPGQARQLLDRVAQQTGKPLTLELKGPDTPEGLRTMNFVREQWAKLGVDVHLESLKPPQMLVTMLQGTFDALVLQQFDFPNPAAEMVFVNPEQVKPIGQLTLSLSRITDAGLSKAIDGVLHSLDLGERKDATAKLQQRLGEVVPFLWLFHGRRYIAARNGVVNLVHHELPDGTPAMDFLAGSHRLDQVWLRNPK
jgi:peptide/nickel transport system substrate-binding protein